MPTHASARVPACHTLKHTDAAFKSMRLDDGWSSSITDWGGGGPTSGRPFKKKFGGCPWFGCVCLVCVLCVLCVFATHTTHTHHTHNTTHTHTHTHTHNAHTHQVRASRVFWSYHYYYYYSRTTACQPPTPPSPPPHPPRTPATPPAPPPLFN